MKASGCHRGLKQRVRVQRCRVEREVGVLRLGRDRLVEIAGVQEDRLRAHEDEPVVLGCKASSASSSARRVAAYSGETSAIVLACGDGAQEFLALRRPATGGREQVGCDLTKRCVGDAVAFPGVLEDDRVERLGEEYVASASPPSRAPARLAALSMSST